MWLWIVLIWLGCSIFSYILIKVSFYILRINGKLGNLGRQPMWTYGDLLWYAIFCLLFGPFSLFTSVVFTIGFLCCHTYDYIKRKRKIRENNWLDKKSPF